MTTNLAVEGRRFDKSKYRIFVKEVGFYSQILPDSIHSGPFGDGFMHFEELTEEYPIVIIGRVELLQHGNRISD